MRRWPCMWALSLAFAAGMANGLELDRTECVVAAKPGGGFDLTCQLAQQGLAQGRYTTAPMRIRYLPGGIGALAYNTVVSQRPAEAQTLVAFSSGTLLNLSQGKFGRFDEHDVRWVAAVAADYGVIVVADDAPYRTLGDLMAAVRANPAKVVFGAGGAIGAQDWMKAALTSRAAGVPPRNMRFVAFEGGGEALTALQGGHVQVCTCDASETAGRIAAGAPLRVLATMSQQRLPGRFAQVPTAREAGFDLVWPITRGFYVGPQVSDADFKAWSDVFASLVLRPDYQRLRSELGLFDLALTGPELQAHIQQSVQRYRRLVQEFGLKTTR